MRFSVFTASTPEWTPGEAARTLAAQGLDGIEWRITDQDEAALDAHRVRVTMPKLPTADSRVAFAETSAAA